MGTHNHHGFTLLELLLALTILSVIVALVSGAFRIGVRAYEKGEQQIEHLQRQRIVLELINRQLLSVQAGNPQKPFFLKGDNSSMEFLSAAPMTPNSEYGNVYVKYIVKPIEDRQVRLLCYEKPVVFGPLSAGKETEFHELIPSARLIRFDYLRTTSASVIQTAGSLDSESSETKSRLNWQPIWNPIIHKGFPKAVKISFQKDEASLPIAVIVRIDRDSGRSER